MNEREIFQTALDISDPARRRAYLDHACGADAASRASIESLLNSHAASRFLNVPAAEQLQASPADPRNTMREMPSRDGRHEDGDEADWSFLRPPTKPGSIGSLGHYEILHVLGRGAFGTVFKAFDEKLHRLVAIKVMNPRMAATSPPRKRFLREARSAAAIRHENIVQVFSVEEEPLPFLVMEYIDGRTLQELLDETGPLDAAEIVHLGVQMACGLEAAHARGLIHRDIKPGNILIEAGVDRRVKITDFGLARAAADADVTRTGMISGTPMYMAPEQATGQALDYRADLFSLGSVLYQMAAGRPPFGGGTVFAVLKRVAEEPPRPIREIIPEVPERLCAIIGKMQAKNPEDRFQSAKEVAEVLARSRTEPEDHGRVVSPGGTPPTAFVSAGEAREFVPGGVPLRPTALGPIDQPRPISRAAAAWCRERAGAVSVAAAALALVPLLAVGFAAFQPPDLPVLGLLAVILLPAVAMAASLWTWFDGKRRSGSTLLDCGPFPGRWLFSLFEGGFSIFSVASVFFAVNNIESPVSAEAALALSWIVLCLAIAFYSHVVAWGRLEIRANGIWCSAGLVRWGEIESWGWAGGDDATLLVQRRGRFLFSGRGALPIPVESRGRVEELLTRYRG